VRPGGAQAGPFGGFFSQAAIRETVESILVAFVLAFLFRTFEAEAFVIPTGSMAPTLMGRNKDLCCPKCGYEYQVSASQEIDPAGNPRPVHVDCGTCPMCRYTADIGLRNVEHKSYPSYNGDRILVAKFPYQFQEPQRWDVIVFKYPGDATTNYIKRLVGLPGETIRVRYGDLWVRKGDAGPFTIARKPPAKLLAMLQPVYNNDLAPRITNVLGWPARWRPEPPAGNGATTWSASADGASFSTEGSPRAESWLRYRHLVPSYRQWQEMLSRGALRLGDWVRPQLISDFQAYNTGPRDGQQPRPGPPDDASLGLHWVGDLAVRFALQLQSGSGSVIVELIKGGRQFQCRIDAATGRATLGIVGPDAADFHPAAVTALRGPGKHRLLLANIDEQLRLWVDGRLVEFDAPTSYDSLGLRTHIPTQADLSPAGIATYEAAATISHLELLRDVYYIAADRQAAALCDFHGPRPELADPGTWPAGFADENMNDVEFSLAPADRRHPDKDQFFVLGDNSAQSKDGRLWDQEHWVSRELLIGKALFIYWPHSWDEIPYTGIPFPFFPNFGRMHLVR
jgi:signal peptidase I